MEIAVEVLRDMTDYHCSKCKRLLLKAEIHSGYIEIKCKCGKIERISVNHLRKR